MNERIHACIVLHRNLLIKFFVKEANQIFNNPSVTIFATLFNSKLNLSFLVDFIIF